MATSWRVRLLWSLLRPLFAAPVTLPLPDFVYLYTFLFSSFTWIVLHSLTSKLTVRLKATHSPDQSTVSFSSRDSAFSARRHGGGSVITWRNIDVQLVRRARSFHRTVSLGVNGAYTQCCYCCLFFTSFFFFQRRTRLPSFVCAGVVMPNHPTGAPDLLFFFSKTVSLLQRRLS